MVVQGTIKVGVQETESYVETAVDLVRPTQEVTVACHSRNEEYVLRPITT